MGVWGRLKGRFAPNTTEKFEMVTMRTGSIFVYRGKLYESDIIRAAIRPKVRAMGKGIATHLERDQKLKKQRANTNAAVRFLLEEPNSYMTGQMLQEKLAIQLELNNNAFAYIEREDGIPTAIYPIDCVSFETQTDERGGLYIRFTMNDGRRWVAKYDNIIHLRKDYASDPLLGEPPGEALKGLMEVVHATDQSVVNAIKNSTVIRWLLKYRTALKSSDLESRAKEFAKTYMATESLTGGVAAIGADADAIQLTDKEFVPNSRQNEITIRRVYAYFNTNEKIVQSSYTEDEWISYYENVVEPDLLQLSNEYTRKLFTRKERSFGNKIVFLPSNLTFASMSTKLKLVQMVDRGIMSPNEVREVLGFAPVDGGDEMIRRLDTRPTKEVEDED